MTDVRIGGLQRRRTVDLDVEISAVVANLDRLTQPGVLPTAVAAGVAIVGHRLGHNAGLSPGDLTVAATGLVDLIDMVDRDDLQPPVDRLGHLAAYLYRLADSLALAPTSDIT